MTRDVRSTSQRTAEGRALALDALAAVPALRTPPAETLRAGATRPGVLPSTRGRAQLRPKVLRVGRRGPLRGGVERIATRCAAARSATTGGGYRADA